MKVNTGDYGQRYEVRCKDEQGQEMTVGWANDPKCLLQAVELHPSYSDGYVIDRKTAVEAVGRNKRCFGC